MWKFSRPKRWAVGLAVVVFSGWTVVHPMARTSQSEFVGPPRAAVVSPGSFAPMVKKLLPAVVNISARQLVTEPVEGPRTGDPALDDLLEEFFSHKVPDGTPRIMTAVGSGFIIDPQGYIVTNGHVVETARSIRVIMHDGRRFEAAVVGTDPATDLALLKVESEQPLPFVAWGSSNQVEIGDWVIAIGNAFGLGGSVTTGVLSARARDLQAGPYDDFLQTDAAINRGNSGGPLFNAAGEVIGVNTVILSPTGGSVGIGFAVPSSTATSVVRQLRERGMVRRGWIGVQLQPMSEPLAIVLGLEQRRGAMVADVVPGGPAEAAGIQGGDVILSVDGRPVEDVRDLPRLVANTTIGKPVDIRVWREGRDRTLRAVIADRETSVAATERTPRPSPRFEREIAPLGLELTPVDPKTRQDLALSSQTPGALVANVEIGSIAAQNDLRPGDVIVSINRKPVAGPREAMAEINRSARNGTGIALVQINRGGSFLYIGVPG